MRKPRRALLFGFLNLWIFVPTARAASATAVSESERLRRCFDDALESKLRDTPEFATYIGFPA